MTEVARTKDVAVETAEDASNAVVAAIGNRLRTLRQEREMTLQDLAEASDLSPSMLSLVERGRAAPSIQSLIVIANALNVTMSELIVTDQADDERIVVRAADQPFVKTAQNVVRRVLREDRARGISLAMNEYEPDTGSSLKRGAHAGFEYGFVLEGQLTVELENVTYQLKAGDLISFESKRPHRFWNNGSKRVRTLWINLKGD
ncbi:cupin domain-containing protein [Bradyrhizobium sp. CCGUVB1N3]|uniref:cupin domain-containing protein n=1 Tax=Bradyrhizobium sp. CCGUVB1N3 TaxID=2949629 RepID=UPI0020B1C62D|nr:cupin domain-containing protein [Bradyrhizobium sp. CCGUVB1N3]MCP3476738.1 cupin domain-containing protein [Bradyrhizobium sp. CCGUVB1N3]